jgi:hypothetical protein
LSDERDLASVSIWGDQNIQKSATLVGLAELSATDPPALTVAPRSRGHLPAIRAAANSGQTFTGKRTVPTIDVRHYTDPELDIHHSFVSLATRARIIRGGGDINQHVIWTAEKPFEPLADALRLMEAWLTGDQRPADAQDRCFEGDGTVIAAGPRVWDGEWNGRPEGACSRRHPPYRSSRTVAGAPMTGEVFKCSLVSVGEAIGAGVYEPVDVSGYQRYLEQIFPTGVCNYAD